MNPEVAHLTLRSNTLPWTSTGIHVKAGDAVTLLGSGFIRWSEHHDIGAGAKFHLWGRIRGGTTFSCTQDTTTVTVGRSGILEVCVYRGAWADRYGALATGPALYERGSGSLHVTAVHWPQGVLPLDGLRTAQLPDADAVLAQAEVERLSSPVTSPPGWHHLLDFGDTDIFRAAHVGTAPAIEVVCDNDMGILTTPMRHPLTPDTVLQWCWRVDALPSTTREDTTWSHDYVSIALEFGNGRDLTWFWSASLEPVETTFACPARAWSQRETHMPVRCGPDGLGLWQTEARNVWHDYARFVGPPPERIVGVWLIAVSHFTRSLGRAEFAGVRLVDGDRAVQIL